MSTPPHQSVSYVSMSGWYLPCPPHFLSPPHMWGNLLVRWVFQPDMFYDQLLKQTDNTFQGYGIPPMGVLVCLRVVDHVLRLTGKRDRLIGCVEKESILGKDISTCLPVSLNMLITEGFSEMFLSNQLPSVINTCSTSPCYYL